MSNDPSDALRTVMLKLHEEVKRNNFARAIRQATDPARALVDLKKLIWKEFDRRKVIDLACRHWIDSGSWPIVDVKFDALLVWERVWEGYIFGGSLDFRGFRPIGKTEVEILNFLLIDGWELVGLPRFQERLIRLQKMEKDRRTSQ